MKIEGRIHQGEHCESSPIPKFLRLSEQRPVAPCVAQAQKTRSSGSRQENRCPVWTRAGQQHQRTRRALETGWLPKSAGPTQVYPQSQRQGAPTGHTCRRRPTAARRCQPAARVNLRSRLPPHQLCLPAGQECKRGRQWPDLRAPVWPSWLCGKSRHTRLLRPHRPRLVITDAKRADRRQTVSGLDRHLAKSRDTGNQRNVNPPPHRHPARPGQTHQI